MAQTLKCNVLLATSTPNNMVTSVAKKYRIALSVNQESNGIASDWNFAFRCARTNLVTIAHQDDMYHPQYLERILEVLNRSKDPLIAFSDYKELIDSTEVMDAKILKIKRAMLKPLSLPLLSRTVFGKRLSIAFGNPICCPAVTYVAPKMPHELFSDGFRSNLDWEMWEKLSRCRGEFVYVQSPLMMHRIHEGSETSSCITDNVRTSEDLQMLEKFWPSFVARLINRFYVKAQDSNQV